MKRLLVLYFLIISTCLYSQVGGFELNYANPASYKLSDIWVKGAKTVSKEYIISISGLRKGDVIEIPGPKLTAAIKKIWKEQIVADIKVNVRPIGPDEVILELVVKEVPRLSDKLYINGPKGNSRYKEIKKGEREDILGLISLQPGKKLTASTISKDKIAIERYFKEKGYWNAKVTDTVMSLDTSYPRENHYELTYYVSKGSKSKINELTIVGNRYIDSKKLKSRLKKTKEKKFYRVFSRSKYIRDELDNDLDAMIGYYNELGFRDAKVVQVNDPSVVDEKVINLEIKIYEGRKYYFRNIDWIGNHEYSTERLNNILGIKKGDIYNKALLDQRLNFNPNGADVSSVYLDNGYLFFNVNPIEIGVEGDSIDLELRIVEGDQATIGNVRVLGNTKTSDHVILRELRTFPGDKFSRSNLIRSQREIAALGYFEPEKIQILPKPNPIDGTVDIDYIVEEKPSDQLQLSGGWGGIVGFVGTLGLVFNNFSLKNVPDFSKWSPLPAGDGQRLAVRFQANGIVYQTYSFSFTEPWLGGKKPNSFTFSLSHSINNNFDQNTRDKLGFLRVSNATISLGKRLNFPDNFFTLSHSLAYLRYDIENFSNFGTTFCDTCVSNAITYSATIARDNRGVNPQFFTSGSMIKFQANLTPPYSWFDPSLSDKPFPNKYFWNEYHKFYIDGEWYIKLLGGNKGNTGIGTGRNKSRPLVLQARTHLGFMGAYSKKMGVGPFERFVVGGSGLSSAGFSTFILGSDIIGLRGYNNGSIGPSLGGTIFNKFVAELRYPIVMEGVASIYVLGFLEAGNNWDTFTEYNPFILRRSGGFGVRIFMPAFGLLGVDYGIPFDANSVPGTDSAGQFNFTIGQQIR